MMQWRKPLPLLALALLAACQSGEPDPQPKAKAETSKSSDRPASNADNQIGTPMAERVAVIGLLNKRNGQTQDFQIRPGEAVRYGKVVVRVRACEKTAPWETYQDQGAFVQLIVRQRPPGSNDPERWAQVFSGWLFKENPAANVVQHPVYDVWVKECRMSFPGEEVAEESRDEEPSRRSSAPQSADKEAEAPAPAAAPAAEVAAAPDADT